MNKNVLYAIIGLLAVVAVVLGYQYYQESQQSGLEINVGGNTLSVETK